ncbi:GTP diphosphokinase rsh1 chloroplastic [Stylosanthes scabra]|uniref:GTP diphosphokinase rsh1 chloroplastic n=1 Tax=Stylosanthes scabra TaxID=79078 RepID=A0ABU6YLC7_9FABA|nr:GTP diphosphokinase rsh1 chloroplastic [Stylosanthes scabra]
MVTKRGKSTGQGRKGREMGAVPVRFKLESNIQQVLCLILCLEMEYSEDSIVLEGGPSKCKSASQRHKQWLQHVKTRSARHKIMKFFREQAARSASNITTKAVNDFVTDSELCYDPHTDTFQARYPPHERRAVAIMHGINGKGYDHHLLIQLLMIFIFV